MLEFAAWVIADVDVEPIPEPAPVDCSTILSRASDHWLF